MSQSSCHCGSCAWCQAKQGVMEFGESIHFTSYQWLPSSSIARGKRYWGIFVETHTLEELEYLLHKVRQENYATTGEH